MSRHIFLDLETTSLDHAVSNIIEAAWIPEIDGKKYETRFFKVQPISHALDQVHGGTDLATFIQDYNSKLTDERLTLAGFAFPDGEMIFQYAKGVLTFDKSVPPKDPSLWLIEDDRIFPDQMFEELLKDLTTLPGHGRWTIVGYNSPYDHGVLLNWIKRVAPADKATSMLNCLNTYNSLDVLSLVRWFSYGNRFPAKTRLVNQQLGTVASALGLVNKGAHTAKGDIEVTYEVAKVLLEAVHVLGENPPILG